MEAKIKSITEEIKHEIVDEIRNTHMTGITPISNNPVVFTMSLSAIGQYGINLSPEYYSSEKQANLVEHFISNCSDLSTLFNKINLMLNDKMIKDKNSRMGLNPNTISVLEKWWDKKPI